ncbi:MAG TPA: hypothetical protein VEA41_22590 [Salinarimonas sp.]|nr:hypothetical protein [Salinarimonas sp.]
MPLLKLDIQPPLPPVSELHSLVGVFRVTENWGSIREDDLIVAYERLNGSRYVRSTGHINFADEPGAPYDYNPDSAVAEGIAAALAAAGAPVDEAPPAFEFEVLDYAVFEPTTPGWDHLLCDRYIGSFKTLRRPQPTTLGYRPEYTVGNKFSVYEKAQYPGRYYSLDANGNGGTWMPNEAKAEINRLISAGKVYVPAEPRTQKARGVRLLTQMYGLPAVVITDEKQLDTVKVGHGGMFARPCPVRPRHGFVESRMVYSSEEVRHLWTEAREADPEAELIVMPFMQCDWSAILTDRLITIGPGHDGATSGKNCVNIPLSGVDLTWTRPALAEGDSAYVEMVYEDRDYSDRGFWPKFVQVRGGPAASGSSTGNWIPQRTVVSQVLRAEGDLLEWEATIHKAPEGTVVWSPGGSMLSHYAVHARLSSIPVILDAEPPAVGAVLEPTGDPKPVIDRDEFRRGCIEGAFLSLDRHSERSRALGSIVMACHHGATWSGPDLSRALGRAAVLFVRLGYAAGIGEFRHNFGGLADQGRESIYDKALVRGAVFDPEIRRLVAGALYSFKHDKWKDGYGGGPWAKCLAAAVEIEDAIRSVMCGPTGKKGTGKIETVLKALNKAINLAHNNGWWLNKFGSQTIFDGVSNGNPEVTAHAALTLANMMREEVGSVGVSAWPAAIEAERLEDPNPGYVAHANNYDGTHDSCGECGACKGCGDSCDCDDDQKPDECPYCDACNCGVCHHEYGCKYAKEHGLKMESPPEQHEQQYHDDDSGDEPVNTGDQPDNQQESDVKYTDTTESRIQAVFRPKTSELHVQVGVPGAYKKTDVPLSFEEAQAWLNSLESRKATRSLAKSSTLYWIIEDVSTVPAKVAEALSSL